jgi:hypothetical protein
MEQAQADRRPRTALDAEKGGPPSTVCGPQRGCQTNPQRRLARDGVTCGENSASGCSDYFWVVSQRYVMETDTPTRDA